MYIYFIPIFTNLGFINIMVVVVRLHWFRKHLKNLGTSQFMHLAQGPELVRRG